VSRNSAPVVACAGPRHLGFVSAIIGGLAFFADANPVFALVLVSANIGGVAM
jgi:hypothetical protein